MLRVMKKAVLLHPLSEGTRGEASGNPMARKFFESLRPAQDTDAVAKRRQGRNLLKEHQKGHRGGTGDSEYRQERQYYNEEFDPGSG